MKTVAAKPPVACQARGLPAFCLMCANVQSNVEKQIPQAANWPPAQENFLALQGGGGGESS
jgi:hypothetical protein